MSSGSVNNNFNIKQYVDARREVNSDNSLNKNNEIKKEDKAIHDISERVLSRKERESGSLSPIKKTLGRDLSSLSREGMLPRAPISLEDILNGEANQVSEARAKALAEAKRADMKLHKFKKSNYILGDIMAARGEFIWKMRGKDGLTKKDLDKIDKFIDEQVKVKVQSDIGSQKKINKLVGKQNIIYQDASKIKENSLMDIDLFKEVYLNKDNIINDINNFKDGGNKIKIDAKNFDIVLNFLLDKQKSLQKDMASKQNVLSENKENNKHLQEGSRQFSRLDEYIRDQISYVMMIKNPPA